PPRQLRAVLQLHPPRTAGRRLSQRGRMGAVGDRGGNGRRVRQGADAVVVRYWEEGWLGRSGRAPEIGILSPEFQSFLANLTPALKLPADRTAERPSRSSDSRF